MFGFGNLPLKVIIKKFEIPCPLPLDEALNDTVKVLNVTLPQLKTTAVDYSEDTCTPKYFVFNSQVTIYNATTRGRQRRVAFLRAPTFERFCPVSQTVYAVPILTFAFVCHPSILPMYEELKE